jgi:hypothetical protein
MAAATDILRTFHRVQPQGETVSRREFVDAQARLEESINSIKKFCQTAIPSGALVFTALSAERRAGNFDASGRGLAGRLWEGWAICNGNNGTGDLSGLTTVVELGADGVALVRL